MPIWMSREMIINNLRLLADWLAIRHPEQKVRLIVAGGAALARDEES